MVPSIIELVYSPFHSSVLQGEVCSHAGTGCWYRAGDLKGLVPRFLLFGMYIENIIQKRFIQNTKIIVRASKKEYIT